MKTYLSTTEALKELKNSRTIKADTSDGVILIRHKKKSLYELKVFKHGVVEPAKFQGGIAHVVKLLEEAEKDKGFYLVEQSEAKAYKEIKHMLGYTLEQCVNELLSYKDRGELGYINFNGTVLYSDTVTMDGAYQEIHGKTKVDFDADQEKFYQRRKEQQREHETSIPKLTDHWVEKGKEILTEDKWDLWAEAVPIRLKDIYQGLELGQCLDIVSILNRGGTFEEAKAKLDSQNHSNLSIGLMRSMVKEFSSRGSEFVEHLK